MRYQIILKAFTASSKLIVSEMDEGEVHEINTIFYIFPVAIGMQILINVHTIRLILTCFSRLVNNRHGNELCQN